MSIKIRTRSPSPTTDPRARCASTVPKAAADRIKTNRRDDGQRVTFTYRDNSDGATKTATVTAEEFVRRFLQHVLPARFQRVRSFGWLSAAAKARRARIESLLAWKRPAAEVSLPLPPPVCPHCRQPMVWVERLARAPPSG